MLVKKKNKKLRVIPTQSPTLNIAAIITRFIYKGSMYVLDGEKKK